MPKRRKLESIPFATVHVIRRSSVQSQLDVLADNGNVYTLDIGGPSSTLDFVMSCWNTAKKDKIALAGSQQGRANGNSSSSFSSLTSTNTNLAGLSGSQNKKLSDDGAEKRDTLMPVGQGESAERGDAAERFGSAPVLTLTPLPVVLPMTSKDTTASELDGSAPSTATAPPADHLAGTEKVQSHQARQPEATTVTPMSTTAPCRNSRHSVTTATTVAAVQSELRKRARLKRESAGLIAATEVVNCNPTAQRHQPLASPPSPLATTTTLGSSPHAGVGGGSPFFFWPVNWLLYFLVSLTAQRHQRFTMLIAYVILAFLMCSTLHLYHRLAMFHLGSASSLVLTPGDGGSSASPGSSPTGKQAQPGSQDMLQQLQQATLQLVELTSRMNQLVAQISREVQRAGVPSEAVEQEPVAV